ncbi:MAG: hypothetical protein WAM04_02560 [Candidatus Sulfotelmatobacter sp.]
MRSTLCSVPGSVSVTGTSATSVMVTVGTTASGSVAGWPSPKFPTDTRLIGWTLALGFSTLLFVSKRSRPAVPAAIIVLAFLTMAACGGSSSTPPGSGSKGTPAGTYTATVTATSGSLSHQVPLTVIVQ